MRERSFALAALDMLRRPRVRSIAAVSGVAVACVARRPRRATRAARRRTRLVPSDRLDKPRWPRLSEDMRSSSIIVLLLASAANALLVNGALRPAAVAARSAPITAQMAPAPLKTRQKVTHKTDGGGGGKGGGAPSAAVAKPKRKTHVEDIPMYKVILLGDAEYEEDPVSAARRTPHCHKET